MNSAFKNIKEEAEEVTRKLTKTILNAYREENDIEKVEKIILGVVNDTLNIKSDNPFEEVSNKEAFLMFTFETIISLHLNKTYFKEEHLINLNALTKTITDLMYQLLEEFKGEKE